MCEKPKRSLIITIKQYYHNFKMISIYFAKNTIFIMNLILILFQKQNKTHKEAEILYYLRLFITILCFRIATI